LQENKFHATYAYGRDVLAGALLGRVLSIFAPVVFGPFAIYPANVSIVMLAMLGAVKRARPELDRLWRVIMGVSLDGAVFLIIRDAYGYNSAPAMISALVLLLLYIVLAPLRARSIHVSRFKVWLSLASAAFMIAWIRVTYLGLSIFLTTSVLGSSFITSTWALGLLLLEYCPTPKSNRGMIALAIVHGIATGWIFDQALFFAMSDMTDAWYQHLRGIYDSDR
jgi:hypothetical protein